ncbi:MAG TPA: glutathione S-transferase family protein [Stellaceae bacterium]|jgi:glutathione S-transferase|nr:glutathione S-transferase family protein [Stellaceae bacterium]
MDEIILHHYERSPFSEKVRLAFGLKGVSWRSVIIPRWMPKPDLMPLTGGYRKTPVMQIGADIYCDTRLILREIDRRFPKPGLFTAGGADLIAAWADSTLFANTVGVVIGTFADAFPPEFKEDRIKFSGGAFDAERMKAHQPAIRAQFRAHLRWIEETFADGREYVMGPAPSIADFALYHTLWFVRGNVKEPDLLEGAGATKAWQERMARFGHGTPTPLDPKAALAIAREANPKAVAPSRAADPSGRKPGEKVIVAANDTGRDPIAGELLAIDDQTIVIRRRHADLGELHQHFPRAGFDLTAG